MSSKRQICVAIRTSKVLRVAKWIHRQCMVNSECGVKHTFKIKKTECPYDTFRFRTHCIKILCCCRCLLRILLVESLNTTGRVKQLVLSGIVRMTRRADFDMDVPHGRAGFEGVPANAGHDRFSVFWVDIVFHCDAFFD